MPHTALDKKANFECLERDVGLAKFFPNVRVHTLARIIYNEYGWDSFPKATNKNWIVTITNYIFELQSVLSTPHIKQKPKILRKAIQAAFKKYGQLTDRECCFKFLEILKSVYRFDQERFRCALGVSAFSII